MTLRSLVAVLAIALVGPAVPAQAQDAPARPPGPTVTVLSRPVGATFRLRGAQDFVGRTPMTLRNLSGRYQVTGSGPGWETWRRTVNLGAADADTIWMTLRPKSAAMGAARSLALPGWGQIYNERPGHAWAMIGLTAAAGTTLLITHFRVLEREDIYADVQRESPGNQPLIRRAKESLDDAEEVRDLALMGLAGAWALNVVDALAFGPPRVPPTVQLGLDVRTLDAPALAVRVRF